MEHAALDLVDVSSGPTLAVKITENNRMVEVAKAKCILPQLKKKDVTIFP